MKDIEFVSYERDFCLCHGILTLRVDGKEVQYKDILVSGGSTGFPNEYNNLPEIEYGPWELSSFNVKEVENNMFRIEGSDICYTKNEIKYIKNLINENVEWGCCGACI